ncbi:zinc finger, CCHC-type containing protein [Tanacetum coccineum]
MDQGKGSVWLKSQGRNSKLKCYICQFEKHLKRDCPRYNHKKSKGFVRNEDQVSGSRADGCDSADVMLEYDGGNILLGDGRECRVRGTGTRRANCVYTLDGLAVTNKKGRKQLGEYQTVWKIKTVIQQQNGLVEETNVTLLAKVRCFLIQSGLSKVFWAEDTTMSTYPVNRSPSLAIGFKTPIDMLGLDDVTSKVVLYRNMGFNKNGEYKKTFIGSGVGMDLVQVLQGVEFEVEPQEDHTFKVEPHGNVNHVAGSQEVQTQDLIYYHLARDREQHSTHKLFSYSKDSNEVAFVVAIIEKIYAHKSLTFNNTVACEAKIWATKGLLDKAKGNVLDMEIVRDQSGDFDVEKNGKWSCIYALGSQEYQVVCTRLDIAFADVGMLDKFDHGLQINVQVFMDFDYAMGRSITVMAGYVTLTEAVMEAIWINGLLTESRAKLMSASIFCYWCLVKGDPCSEVPAMVEVDVYRRRLI